MPWPTSAYSVHALPSPDRSFTNQPVQLKKAYVKCACQYCGPLLAGPAWSKRHAGLHYVHNVAMLTAAVAPLGATPHEVHKAVASMVRAAALFAAGKRLTGQSAPAHLRTWDRVL